MDKNIKWTKERDFATLDMFQEDYTDEDLVELGMTSEDINDFREWQENNN